MYRQVRIGDIILEDDEILDAEHPDAYEKGNYFQPIPQELIGTRVQYKSKYIRRLNNLFDLKFKIWE